MKNIFKYYFLLGFNLTTPIEPLNEDPINDQEINQPQINKDFFYPDRFFIYKNYIKNKTLLAKMKNLGARVYVQEDLGKNILGMPIFFESVDIDFLKEKQIKNFIFNKRKKNDTNLFVLKPVFFTFLILNRRFSFDEVQNCFFESADFFHKRAKIIILMGKLKNWEKNIVRIDHLRYNCFINETEKQKLIEDFLLKGQIFVVKDQNNEKETSFSLDHVFFPAEIKYFLDQKSCPFADPKTNLKINTICFIDHNEHTIKIQCCQLVISFLKWQTEFEEKSLKKSTINKSDLKSQKYLQFAMGQEKTPPINPVFAPVYEKNKVKKKSPYESESREVFVIKPEITNKLMEKLENQKYEIKIEDNFLPFETPNIIVGEKNCSIFLPDHIFNVIKTDNFEGGSFDHIMYIRHSDLQNENKKPIEGVDHLRYCTLIIKKSC